MSDERNVKEQLIAHLGNNRAILMVVGCGGPTNITFPDKNLESANRDAS